MRLQFATEAAIVRLVDAFYGKMKGNPALGPIFDEAIGAEGWPMHLAKMYAFWSSVMLATGRYKGNPMAAHRAVQGSEPAEQRRDRLTIPPGAAGAPRLESAMEGKECA